MLLASTYEPTDSSTRPEHMSDTQIRDEVLTIFLAGYETVANALTWTWYLLSQNPEVEARLHAELDRVLGTGNSSASPQSPTTPTSSTPSRSSANPCASTHPHGPWAASPSKT
jgi:cytochrome P450